ncbi:hypothetical protein AVEN_171613-1 [Araneus ventricosus]|uniref:Uncharacterized protein n=1 Tax=Araneus ventricosus TaxID=182803 RepID=A0A4Y2U5K9_ARAVE|nr:hypothetical protein AVEN_171613-1 [Araneus ventricosus]
MTFLYVKALIPRRFILLLTPLKPGLFGRKRHEVGSPKMGGHFFHPNPFYNLPLKRKEMGCGSQGYLDPLPRLSPKRSQNLTSPQKKPNASDPPSSLLRGNFKATRG